jgi:hypothetical protein
MVGRKLHRADLRHRRGDVPDQCAGFQGPASRPPKWRLAKAKSDGRNALAFFDTEMEERIQQRSHLERDLRQALERDEFVIFYSAAGAHDRKGARL